MPLSIGDRAPAFRLRGTDDAHWILGESDRRRAVLVVFLGRASAACRALMPYVERLQRRTRRGTGEILGISLDDIRDTLEFAEDYCFTFPILLESGGRETFRSYGVESVPTLFRLDRRLEIREVLVGWSREGFERLGGAYLDAIGAPDREIWEEGDRAPDRFDATPLPDPGRSERGRTGEGRP